MRVLVSLLMLIVLAVIARQAQLPSQLAEQLSVTLVLGFMLLGAWLTGRLFDHLHLPKVSGYLLFGLAVGPSVWSLIPLDWAGGAGQWLREALPLVSAKEVKQMRFVSDLAIAVIALTAGGEIKFSWLRDKIWRLLTLIGVDLGLMLPLGILVTWLLRDWIPYLQDQNTQTALVVGVLTATIMIANSPAVVIALISDLRSDGPLTQTALALTILKDLVLIVLFATVTAWGTTVLDPQRQLSAEFLVAVAAQIFGSLLVGGVFGLIMALYVARVRAHMTIFIIGCSLLIALIGEQDITLAGYKAHLEPLLMALMAGLVMQNIWPARTAPLFKAVEEMSLPVYALFFAVAGAKIDLTVFARLWYVTLVMVAVRVSLVWVGITAGAHLAGFKGPWVRWMWLGMIPQAGVTLVLITLVSRGFDHLPWGRELGSMLLGMLVIHELLGPIGFRYALQRSGEVGKAHGAVGPH